MQDSPFSFFQTNTKGAEVLYTRARDYILGNSIEQEHKEEIDTVAVNKVNNIKNSEKSNITGFYYPKISVKGVGFHVPPPNYNLPSVR